MTFNNRIMASGSRLSMTVVSLCAATAMAQITATAIAHTATRTTTHTATRTTTQAAARTKAQAAANTTFTAYANPVIPGIADAGCVRFAGKYYLGGVSTYGDFFESTDLVHWPQRVHVFDLDNQWTHGTGAKNNQIHADDISYSGGQFHLLFSANYWGQDRHIVHITHATSPTVTGPYREVRDDQWFENRIDPMVFRDDDGRLYLYMVKFTDGNTIWGRPLNPDFTFAGDAVQQFSSQPGTWETYDNRVAEGPFVVKYRGRFYMMYNANHTSPSFGNYRLGVCEASSPLGFGPGGKNSWPVVGPNTEAIDDNHADLLHYGTGEWQPLRPVDGNTAAGVAAVGDGGNVSSVSAPGTASADTLLFALSDLPRGNAWLKIVQRGGVSVAINGHAVNEAGSKADYRLFPIDRSWLRRGDNTLTLRREHGDKGTLSGIALYDMGDTVPDDLLVTPGQPNIVRGPNGWEWWLVYMANEGWKRSQFIDRIHFTAGRLAVDGITGAHTKGFHPAPALPQWTGTSLDSVPSSAAYLLEIAMQRADGRQGISVGTQTVMLPESMADGNVHEWRIEKNHSLLTVWADQVLVADRVAVPDGDAKVTLVGDASAYGIKHVSYNEGFDEYADRFGGWPGLAADSTGLALAKGTWLKGRAAKGYEWSVQTDDHAAAAGRYGVMAAYADERNYVSAEIDAAGAQLLVTQCVKGKRKTTAHALATEQVVYPDVKYTDTYEKQYRFDSDTYVNAVMLPHRSPDNDPYAHDLGIAAAAHDTYVADVASTQDVSWLDGDTWRPLAVQPSQSGNPAWQRVEFPTVKTRALRFINRSATDMHRNIYRIKVGSERQSVNQLRVERRGREVRLFLNDRLMQTVTLAKDAATRCGLVSDGAAAVTVGNALWYVVGE